MHHAGQEKFPTSKESLAVAAEIRNDQGPTLSSSPRVIRHMYTDRRLNRCNMPHNAG